MLRPASVLATLCLSIVAACSLPETTMTFGPIKSQLTDWPGAEGSARFSADGSRIAFEATVDGQTDLYAMALDTSGVERLTDLPSIDRRPAWSPDGTEIAFHSNRSEGAGLWIMGADGTRARLVLAQNEDVQLGGPDWSPDGLRLAATKVTRHGEGNLTWGRATVVVVDITGENLREITSGGDEWWPRWGPDSDWLYYYVGASDDLEAVHVETGEILEISGGRYVGWRPVPSKDGSSIVFTSDAGPWGLWIAPLKSAGMPIQLTRDGRNDIADISPDGRRVVFNSDRSRPRAMRLHVASGVVSLLADGARDPQELPDGRVGFLSDRFRPWDIVVGEENGPRPRRLETKIQRIVEAAFARDGSRIAVVSMGYLDGRYDITILGEDGESTGVATSSGAAESPVWCGSDSVLFSSRGESDTGFRQVWRLDPDDGTVVELTKSDVDKRPTDCSNDGRRITYRLTGGASGIRVAELGDGSYPTTMEVDGVQGTWSPDGSELAFVARRGGSNDLYMRRSDGTDVQLTEDDAVESLPRWSGDGDSLLYSVSEPNIDIWLLSVPDLSWR